MPIWSPSEAKPLHDHGRKNPTILVTNLLRKVLHIAELASGKAYRRSMTYLHYVEVLLPCRGVIDTDRLAFTTHSTIVKTEEILESLNPNGISVH